MSPKALARTAAVLAMLEGNAAVWGQLRIPDRLVASTDAAATAANILGHESLFRLGLVLSVLAVAFNGARMALTHELFRPVGRAARLMAYVGLLAVAFQAGCVLLELPVLLVLRNGKDWGAFDLGQQQALALLFMRWNGQAVNLYLAFFGLWCMVLGYVTYRSTFLPRVLGVLMALAGLGYATYLWPPFAKSVYPWNLTLGVGEIALGLWLLVFGVDTERWKERARAARELES